MAHIHVASGERTLCGRWIPYERLLPVEAAHRATCSSCLRSVRAQDRALAAAEGREADQVARRILVGARAGIDGIESLPSEARATLRRKGMRRA